MSRWMKMVSCAMLLYTAQNLVAWAPLRSGQTTQSLPTSPLNDDQGWFTRESYLFWLPYEDDLDYANKVSQEKGTPFVLKMKLEKPDFEWNSGVRFGFGKYLPHHHLWDVSVDATYFYGEADDHSTQNRDNGSILVGKWPPLFEFFSTAIQFNGVEEGSVHWKLNFFYEDLTVGRMCNVTRMITARPFIGLRSVQFYEDQKSSLKDSIPTNSAGIAIDRNLQWKGNSNYWGIGPRVGTDFTFKFSDNWSLLGNLSGSFFFGHYNVKENIAMDLTESFAPFIADIGFNFKGSDHGYGVRSNLEGSLGLGWEMWVRNRTVRLAPSVMFEASEWFDMNQWLDFRIPTLINEFETTTLIVSDRRHGDLGFIGVTFNFHVDF